jgi:hypothetical protein
MQPALLLMAVMVVSIVLFQVNHRIASPVIAIVNRWLRWFIFALGASYLCIEFGIIERPYWQLALAFFLLWFLGETVYNWLAIRALSVSPLPLFPRYTANDSGEEWPIQPRLLRVRDWLRAQGYRQVQAVRAEIGGGIHLRASIYQDPEATIRIHVMFLPQPGGSITLCASLSSQASDGLRYVTDNLFVPFGGFYPEAWHVDRHPWCRSLPRLIRRHRATLQRAGAVPESWAVDPVFDLNAQQSELDRLNTDLGFLHPQHEREDLGKITSQGCYRVWKEIWMLDYLGRPIRAV